MGPPLGPVGEDITWPDQVAPRGRKASSTSKIEPQTSNLFLHWSIRLSLGTFSRWAWKYARLSSSYIFTSCCRAYGITLSHGRPSLHHVPADIW